MNLLAKYKLEDKFMYIDRREIDVLADLSTLSFHYYGKIFTTSIPPLLQEEIRSARFPAERTYLLLSIGSVKTYSATDLAWNVHEESLHSAFVWLLIDGNEAMLQPVRNLQRKLSGPMQQH